jgi:hypothetical protein
MEQGYFKVQQTKTLGSLEYFSWRKVKTILESPLAFYETYKEQQVFEPTKAMEFGNLVHLALLEPKKFRERFVVEPVFIGKTKKGEDSTRCDEAYAKRDAWREEQLRANRVIVEQEQLDQIIRIVERVLEHDKAREILTGGRAEGWAYAWDEIFGRWILGRPDFIAGDGTVVEIKTTAKSLDRRSIKREIFNQQYHGQLALNCRAVGIIEGFPDFNKGLWIFIKTKRPYDVAVYTASENIMLAGRALAFKGMHKINDHLKRDPDMGNKKMWPGIQPGYVEEIDFDPWMLAGDDTYEEITNENQP